MSQQAIWGENKQRFQLKISEVDFQKDLDDKIDEELVKTHMSPGFIWEFCLLNHAMLLNVAVLTISSQHGSVF